MKAKLVNEGIKHLSGRSEEEMREDLEQFPLWQQFMIAKERNIRITAEEHDNMKKDMERVIKAALNHIGIKKYELITFEDVKLNDNVIVFAYNSIEGFFYGNVGKISYISTKKLPSTLPGYPLFQSTNFVIRTSGGGGERFYPYNIWGIAKIVKKPAKDGFYDLTTVLQSIR